MFKRVGYGFVFYSFVLRLISKPLQKEVHTLRSMWMNYAAVTLISETILTRCMKWAWVLLASILIKESHTKLVDKTVSKLFKAKCMVCLQ